MIIYYEIQRVLKIGIDQPCTIKGKKLIFKTKQIIRDYSWCYGQKVNVLKYRTYYVYDNHKSKVFASDASARHSFITKVLKVKWKEYKLIEKQKAQEKEKKIMDAFDERQEDIDLKIIRLQKERKINYKDDD